MSDAINPCAPHQVPDLLRVAADIKEHAAHVADLQSALTSSFSHGSKARRHKIAEIWTSIYSAASLTQPCIIQFSAQRGGMKHQLALLCAACDGRDYRKHMISQPVLEEKEVQTIRQQMNGVYCLQQYEVFFFQEILL